MKRAQLTILTVAGLGLALILTLLTFGLPLRESLLLMREGAFGSELGIATTLVKATPLLLVGLGMLVAWRAGMYNIGGEGQFVIGALASAACAKALPLEQAPALMGPLLLVAGVLGGAAWAWLAAWLHVRRGVQVVIGTILLNFVAVQIVSFMVRGPLQERSGQLPLTDPLPNAAMLARFSTRTDLHSGVFVALAAAVVVFVILFRTVGGFELRIVGQNPRLARANRIDASRVQLWAMALSGGLCGLAGSVEYAGIAGRIGGDFAQGWGFLGIPVALLGGLHPVGAFFASLYFGALFAGSQNLARFTVGASSMVYVIQGIAVLGFVALQVAMNRRQVHEESSA